MAAENTSLKSEIELLRKCAPDAKDIENYRLALNKMIAYLDLKLGEDFEKHGAKTSAPGYALERK